jgi:hypothetical protein
MSNEALAVMLGAAIGIIGSNASTFLVVFLSNRKRARSIHVIVQAEIKAIEEKAQRYINGQSTFEELGASTPMLTSIAPEIGFLSVDQAVAFRETVTLDTEMRKVGTKEKAAAAVAACRHAIHLLSN